MAKLSNFQTNQLARTLLRLARRFYANPDNVKKYVEWHIKKYGFAPTEGVGISTKENQ